MTAIKINSKYKPLYTTDKRYIIVTGGRGSGKTFAVQDFLLRLLEQKGQGVLYTRYTMTSVDKTIIPLFCKHIEKVSSFDRYEITKQRIINKVTGAFILFSGIKTSSGDQTANLKTLPDITTWVIEEGEDFDNEKSFVDIDDSIRSKDIQNRIIWIQNPTTREHFIYQKFFEGNYVNQNISEAGPRFTYQKSIHQNVEHIHTTYLDNKENLNHEKVQQWEQTKVKNPDKYQNKYLGAWIDKAEGVIFDNWTEGDFDESLSYCYGQDYGFSTDPTTLIRVAICNKTKRVFVHEEFYQSIPLGTNDIFDVNLHRLKSKNDLIVADSAEQRLIYDLHMKGLNIEGAVKGPGSIQAGITSLLDFQIVVTPDSHNIKKELKNYCWNNKKAGIPIDDYNHAIDAIRYASNKLINNLNPYIFV